MRAMKPRSRKPKAPPGRAAARVIGPCQAREKAALSEARLRAKVEGRAGGITENIVFPQKGDRTRLDSDEVILFRMVRFLTSMVSELAHIETIAPHLTPEVADAMLRMDERLANSPAGREASQGDDRSPKGYRKAPKEAQTTEQWRRHYGAIDEQLREEGWQVTELPNPEGWVEEMDSTQGVLIPDKE